MAARAAGPRVCGRGRVRSGGRPAAARGAEDRRRCPARPSGLRVFPHRRARPAIAGAGDGRRWRVLVRAEVPRPPRSAAKSREPPALHRRRAARRVRSSLCLRVHRRRVDVQSAGSGSPAAQSQGGHLRPQSVSGARTGDRPRPPSFPRFGEIWPEVRAFIRTGRFTAGASRMPPASDRLDDGRRR